MIENIPIPQRGSDINGDVNRVYEYIIAQFPQEDIHTIIFGVVEKWVQTNQKEIREQKDLVIHKEELLDKFINNISKINEF